jgi:hypothetical protein
MIREIPKSFEYTCDRCGATHRQESAEGHYTESTPPEWLTIKTIHMSKKYNQNRLAVLLCTNCFDLFSEVMGTFLGGKWIKAYEKKKEKRTVQEKPEGAKYLPIHLIDKYHLPPHSYFYEGRYYNEYGETLENPHEKYVMGEKDPFGYPYGDF